MRIYLASPYSHPQPYHMKRRYDKALLHAGLLLNEGHIVYSPIAHNHPIAEVHGLPTGWDYWEKFDRAFIEWCDTMVILKLSGWSESKGIAAEKSIAIELSKPIVHWNPLDPLPDLNF